MDVTSYMFIEALLSVREPSYKGSEVKDSRRKATEIESLETP